VQVLQVVTARGLEVDQHRVPAPERVEGVQFEPVATPPGDRGVRFPSRLGVLVS